MTEVEEGPASPESAPAPVPAATATRHRGERRVGPRALGWATSGWGPPLDASLIVVGLVLILLIPVVPAHPDWHPGQLFWHDGWERYRLVEALTHGTSLGNLERIDPAWSGRWPLLPTLLATPLWYLGALVLSPAWWLAAFNWLVFAGGLVLVWRTLRPTVPPGMLRAFLLLLVCASMFPGHLVAFMPLEVFAAVLIGFGLVAACHRRPVLGWSAAALGAASVPAALPALGLVAALHAVRARRWRHLAAPAAALVLILLDNLVRHRGSLGVYAIDDSGPATVLPYSGGRGFSYPWWLGLLGLLASFGKGLVFFAPSLFLPARRALLGVSAGLWRAQQALLVAVAGLLAAYCTWWGWDGGFFWGPRFLVLASVPACLALAALLHRPPASLLLRVGLLAALAWSVWVGVNGAAFGLAGLPFCDPASGGYGYLCVDTPEYSPLFHPFVALPPLRLPQVLFLAFGFLAFLRLAGPLMAGVARDVRTRVRAVHPEQLLVGWRP